MILEALERFGEEKIAIAWTSGKDSTALLNLIRETLDGQVPIPVIFVDTGKHFDTVYKFRDDLAKKWGLNLIIVMNTEIINATEKGVVRISKSSEEMKEELRLIGWNKKEFRIALDREPCCHLLKSVATKKAIIENSLNFRRTNKNLHYTLTSLALLL